MNDTYINIEKSRILKDGKIQLWPKKRKLQLEILHFLVNHFSVEACYSQNEVNDLIDGLTVFKDAALLRRELIEAKLIFRRKDGSLYSRDLTKLQ